MKKVIFPALGAVFASLVLVGCLATEESAPVGAAVRLVDPNGGTIDMYEAPSPSSTTIANWPSDQECEVLSGPNTAADVTFWELECVEAAGYVWVGWVDVTKIEVLSLGT